jgi:nucleoside-diphosphate-sugar epimerase
MSELIAMRKIQVLGASGPIGGFVTDDLRIRGFDVVGVARKFSAPATARTRLTWRCRSC